MPGGADARLEWAERKMLSTWHSSVAAATADQRARADRAEAKAEEEAAARVALENRVDELTNQKEQAEKG